MSGGGVLDTSPHAGRCSVGWLYCASRFDWSSLCPEQSVALPGIHIYLASKFDCLLRAPSPVPYIQKPIGNRARAIGLGAIYSHTAAAVGLNMY